jgi:hypothetical protein
MMLRHATSALYTLVPSNAAMTGFDLPQHLPDFLALYLFLGIAAGLARAFGNGN